MDVGVLSLLAMVIKQADKMIISGLLPIAQLGFFNSASMAANALTNLSRPVQIAVFPRLTRMAATPGDPRLASTFHQACRVVTFVTAAPAAVLVFFPYVILAFWTRSIPLAEAATVPLMLLALAMMINVSTVVPFALQLAAGITWLPVRNNAIWALAYPALVYGLVSRLGIVGAGWAWVTYNAIYAVTVPAVMFRHILKGEFWKWFGRDTLPYMVLALGLFWGAATLAGGSGLGMKAVVAALAAVVYVAVALSLDSGLRRIAVTALSQLRRR